MIALAPTHPMAHGSRLRRLRRMVALFVAGAFGLGCLEPIFQPVLAMHLLAAPVLASDGAAGTWASAARSSALRSSALSGTRAAALASGQAHQDGMGAGSADPAEEQGPLPAPGPDAHACPCALALVASATVPEVPLSPPVAASVHLARPSADRLPASPTPELRLRPPATRG